MKLPPRCIPLAFPNEDCKELEKLKKGGVIQPSTSPWPAPLVMVWKQMWSTKNVPGLLAVKYNNKGCGIPNTPYPGLFGCSSGSNSSFLTMDITAAYHQIPVAEEDIPKTAFITKYGLYEFKDYTIQFENCAPKTY